jgi:phosphoglycolate phosphatase
MIRFFRRFDPQAIRLLIFDLDGTLIDSRLDLIHSVNAMLRHVGRPELADDVIASYVGDGAPVLVRRALFGQERFGQETNGTDQSGNECDEALFKQAHEYFLGYYRMHKLDHTIVYDGIPKVLNLLANGGGSSKADKSVRPTRLMAVLSNKPVRPSQDIVQALGLGDYFVRIYGGNSFATKKPDPLGARTLLEETGVAAEQTLMIGDSGVDVLTGRNAGLWTCGVTYGFAPHTLEATSPDVVVERPSDFAELFGQSLG